MLADTGVEQGYQRSNAAGSGLFSWFFKFCHMSQSMFGCSLFVRGPGEVVICGILIFRLCFVRGVGGGLLAATRPGSGEG